MAETVRAHERVRFDTSKGTIFYVSNILPKPVFVYIPQKAIRKKSYTLLIHFFGSAEIVAQAAERNSVIGAAVNLGSGSAVYAKPFKDGSLYAKLLKAINAALAAHLSEKPLIQKKVYLSAFSAGYGAVREIISQSGYISGIDGILLLDGLHTGYIPDRKLLADGGRLDSTQMKPFKEFARLASIHNGLKKFLFTHSEIFPGTFSSTTETAEFLSKSENIEPRPVLQWGPGGMQQISIAKKNRFKIMGFAGNTAPDHMDHLHNLAYFLGILKK